MQPSPFVRISDLLPGGRWVYYFLCLIRTKCVKSRVYYFLCLIRTKCVKSRVYYNLCLIRTKFVKSRIYYFLCLTRQEYVKSRVYYLFCLIRQECGKQHQAKRNSRAVRISFCLFVRTLKEHTCGLYNLSWLDLQLKIDLICCTAHGLITKLVSLSKIQIQIKNRQMHHHRLKTVRQQKQMTNISKRKDYSCNSKFQNSKGALLPLLTLTPRKGEPRNHIMMNYSN